MDRVSIEPTAFELRDFDRGALIGGYSPTSRQFHFPLFDVCQIGRAHV